jgi:RNA polymerase sigma-70 factor (ECF subfamily)
VLWRRKRGALRVPVSVAHGPEAPDVTAAWGDLRGSLLGFIARGTPDRDTAEDILQEVLLRIHRHAGELEHAPAVRAWIFQIARNAIADHYRRASVRREQPVGVDLGQHEPPPAEPAPAELSGELAACLTPLLQRLAPPFREALILTELEGLTQTEAAARLGLSTSGMKSRVQRARVQLRDLLVGCCEIELDRRNRVTAYLPRREPCDCRAVPPRLPA